jgi:hypothetical protein
MCDINELLYRMVHYYAHSFRIRYSSGMLLYHFIRTTECVIHDNTT